MVSRAVAVRRGLRWPFVILLFLAGCATTANYEKILKSWVGAHVNNLVRRLGSGDGRVRARRGTAWLRDVWQEGEEAGRFLEAAERA